MSLVDSIFGGSKAATKASSKSAAPSSSLSALFDSSVSPAPKRSILINEKPKKRDRDVGESNEPPLAATAATSTDPKEESKNENISDDERMLQKTPSTKKARNDEDNNNNNKKSSKRDASPKRRNLRSQDNQDHKEKEEIQQASESTLRDNSFTKDQKAKPVTTETPKRKKERKPKQETVESTDTTPTSAANDKTSPPPAKTDDNNDPTEDPEDRTIFVGNLPIATTTRKTLERLFRSCGKIESTRLRSLPVVGVKLPPERAGDHDLAKKVAANTLPLDATKKNTIHGYVVFEDAASVAKALMLNNTFLPDTQIRIRVDSANPTLDPSRSVFVGNLPYHADETSLQNHFITGCGFESPDDVEGVRIVRDPTTFACKGFGYVLFKTKTMTATALAKMHESVYMKRTLRVMVCGKRYKGRRGQPKSDDHAVGLPTKSTTAKSSPKPKHHQHQLQEKRASDVASTASTPLAALRRILRKEQLQKGANSKTNKRKRGSVSSSSSTKKGVLAKKSGSSKRAVAEAKVGKRVKKLEKRISKGMGKSKG